MSLFDNLFKSSNSSKKSESKQGNSQSDETFILEPILTPSGLIDGDDGSDPVIIEPDLDLGEDLDFENLEGEDNSEVLSSSNPEEGLEPLLFVDSEDSETESEETNVSPEVVEATVEDGFSDDEIEPISFFDGEEIELEDSAEVVDVNSSDTTEDLVVEETENSADENLEATEDLVVDESSEVEEIAEELVVEETENSADENLEATEDLVVEESSEAEEISEDLVVEETENSAEENSEATEDLVVEESSEVEEIAEDLVVEETENSADENLEATEDLVVEESSEVEEIAEDLVVEETENSADENLEATEDLVVDESSEVVEEEVIDEGAIATFEKPKPNFDMGVFTVTDTEGEVGVDFLFDGGGYGRGEVAIFNVEGMEDFEFGSPEFIKEAARRGLSNSELGHVVISDSQEGARFSGELPREKNFNFGEYRGVKTFKMGSGDKFAVMLVPNNSLQKVFDNPEIKGSSTPLFSLATANPNDEFHVGQIADINGEGNAFAFEDLRADSYSDRDYNDVIFQVRGATGKAAKMEDLINENRDWRSSDLGEGLLSYTEPYITPDNSTLKFEDLLGNLIEDLEDLIETENTEISAAEEIVEFEENLGETEAETEAEVVSEIEENSEATSESEATNEAELLIDEAEEVTEVDDKLPEVDEEEVVEVASEKSDDLADEEVTEVDDKLPEVDEEKVAEVASEKSDDLADEEVTEVDDKLPEVDEEKVAEVASEKSDDLADEEVTEVDDKLPEVDEEEVVEVASEKSDDLADEEVTEVDDKLPEVDEEEVTEVASEKSDDLADEEVTEVDDKLPEVDEEKVAEVASEKSDEKVDEEVTEVDDKLPEVDEEKVAEVASEKSDDLADEEVTEVDDKLPEVDEEEVVEVASEKSDDLADEEVAEVDDKLPEVEEVAEVASEKSDDLADEEVAEVDDKPAKPELVDEKLPEVKLEDESQTDETVELDVENVDIDKNSTPKGESQPDETVAVDVENVDIDKNSTPKGESQPDETVAVDVENVDIDKNSTPKGESQPDETVAVDVENVDIDKNSTPKGESQPDETVAVDVENVDIDKNSTPKGESQPDETVAVDVENVDIDKNSTPKGESQPDETVAVDVENVDIDKNSTPKGESQPDETVAVDVENVDIDKNSTPKGESQPDETVAVDVENVDIDKNSTPKGESQPDETVAVDVENVDIDKNSTPKGESQPDETVAVDVENVDIDKNSTPKGESQPDETVAVDVENVDIDKNSTPKGESQPDETVAVDVENVDIDKNSTPKGESQPDETVAVDVENVDIDDNSTPKGESQPDETVAVDVENVDIDKNSTPKGESQPDETVAVDVENVDIDKNSTPKGESQPDETVAVDVENVDIDKNSTPKGESQPDETVAVDVENVDIDKNSTPKGESQPDETVAVDVENVDIDKNSTPKGESQPDETVAVDVENVDIDDNSTPKGESQPDETVAVDVENVDIDKNSTPKGESQPDETVAVDVENVDIDDNSTPKGESQPDETVAVDVENVDIDKNSTPKGESQPDETVAVDVENVDIDKNSTPKGESQPDETVAVDVENVDIDKNSTPKGESQPDETVAVDVENVDIDKNSTPKGESQPDETVAVDVENVDIDKNSTPKGESQPDETVAVDVENVDIDDNSTPKGESQPDETVAVDVENVDIDKNSTPKGESQPDETVAVDVENVDIDDNSTPKGESQPDETVAVDVENVDIDKNSTPKGESQPDETVAVDVENVDIDKNSTPKGESQPDETVAVDVENVDIDKNSTPKGESQPDETVAVDVENVDIDKNSTPKGESQPDETVAVDVENVDIDKNSTPKGESQPDETVAVDVENVDIDKNSTPKGESQPDETVAVDVENVDIDKNSTPKGESQPDETVAVDVENVDIDKNSTPEGESQPDETVAVDVENVDIDKNSTPKGESQPDETVAVDVENVDIDDNLTSEDESQPDETVAVDVENVDIDKNSTPKGESQPDETVAVDVENVDIDDNSTPKGESQPDETVAVDVENVDIDKNSTPEGESQPDETVAVDVENVDIDDNSTPKGESQPDETVKTKVENVDIDDNLTSEDESQTGKTVAVDVENVDIDKNSTPEGESQPDETVKTVEETPEVDASVEQTPEVEETPEVDASVEQTPEVEETPEVDASVEQTPEVEETPEVDASVEQTPEVEETPEVDASVEQTPEVEETPEVDASVEQTPEVEETPEAVEQTPEVEETPEVDTSELSPPVPQNESGVNDNLIVRLENLTNTLKESAADANSKLPVSETLIQKLEDLTTDLQEQSENGSEITVSSNTVKLVERLEEIVETTSSPPEPAPVEPPVDFEFAEKDRPLVGSVDTKFSADSLIEFVDAVKASGKPNGVYNVSLDLTETNPDGTTTTRELTAVEKEAIAYAQQHEVLIVASAGNDGDGMSALGRASREFDNIITVGAAEQTDSTVSVHKGVTRAEYSGYGEELELVAIGATGDDAEASGTSVATAKVTDAVDKVWAANPELNYTQVIDILKRTATDLEEANWDRETGSGLLNIAAAVQLAKVTSGVEVETSELPSVYPSFYYKDDANEPVAIPLWGNSLSRARYISLGQTIYDRVSSYDRDDYYRFSISHRTRANLTLSGMTADADLYLLSSSGRTLASSIRGGRSTDYLTRDLTPGTYYIRVKHHSGSTSYRLSTSGQSLNRAPVVSVSNQTANVNQYIRPSFRVTDADRDRITHYYFDDTNRSSSSGYFTVNGVKKTGGFTVSASQLSKVLFRGGRAAGSDRVRIQAYDGKAWSSAKYFNVATKRPNRAPVVSVGNQTANVNQYIRPSFRVTDADRDRITHYYFDDTNRSSSSGYFTVNGVKKTGGFVVSASQLSKVLFRGGRVAGSDRVRIQAYDGKAWSGAKYFNVATKRPNRAPVVSVGNQTANVNQYIRPSFRVTDADRDRITHYYFDDTNRSSSSGYFTVNGVKKTGGFLVSASQLSKVLFRGGRVAGSDRVRIQAYDGKAWSGAKYFNVATKRPNRAPIVSVGNQTANINQYIRPSFRVTDADRDRITHYYFDDTNRSSSSGYFTVNGVKKTGGFLVSASQLSKVLFRGGRVAGSDRVRIQAYDGKAWSGAKYFNVATKQPNRAPVVSVSNQTANVNQYIRPSFRVTDADRDRITHYYFDDTNRSSSSGYFTVNGVKKTGGFLVSASQLSKVLFRGDRVTGSDRVRIQAYDGKVWSGAKYFNISTNATGPKFTNFSAVDASGDGSSNTVFQRGALRFNWATNVGNSVKVYARNNTTGAVTQLSIHSRNGTLLTNLNSQRLAAGTYTIYAEARDARGSVGRSTPKQIRVLAFDPYSARSVKKGDFKSNAHLFSGMTQGSVFVGRGGTDTLNLGNLRSTSVTFDPNKRAVFGGTTFDWLRVNSTGQEIYFQGYESLKFSNGTINLGVKPNDPLFSQQWNLRMTDVPGAWRFTTGSSKVLLGIADSGLNLNSSNKPTHYDLNSGRAIADVSDRDTIPVTSSARGHGTAVQSVVAADTNDGYGMAGINWNSPIYVSKVFGPGWKSFASAAQEQINYARARGQKLVYNLSGEYIRNFNDTALSNLMQQNSDTALFVIASGNSKNRANNVVSPPANFAGQYGNVMAVGAAGGSNGNSAFRHDYSQYGRELTLVAPSRILAANIDGGHDTFGGTSFAAPSAAGVASLVWSANTALKAGDIKSILTSTANKVWRSWGGSNSRNEYGAGLIDAEAAVRRADALKRNNAVAGLFNHQGWFFA